MMKEGFIDMEVVFGQGNVIIEAGKTKAGEWVCKFQRISKKATYQMLENDEWKKYIDNSPCILKFETVTGINQVIKSLTDLKKIMIESEL